MNLLSLQTLVSKNSVTIGAFNILNNLSAGCFVCDLFGMVCISNAFYNMLALYYVKSVVA